MHWPHRISREDAHWRHRSRQHRPRRHAWALPDRTVRPLAKNHSSPPPIPVHLQESRDRAGRCRRRNNCRQLQASGDRGWRPGHTGPLAHRHSKRHAAPARITAHDRRPQMPHDRRRASRYRAMAQLPANPVSRDRRQHGLQPQNRNRPPPYHPEISLHHALAPEKQLAADRPSATPGSVVGPGLLPGFSPEVPAPAPDAEVVASHWPKPVRVRSQGRIPFPACAAPPPPRQHPASRRLARSGCCAENHADSRLTPNASHRRCRPEIAARSESTRAPWRFADS